MKVKVSAKPLSALLTLSVLFWSSVSPALTASTWTGQGVKPGRSARQPERAGSVRSKRRQPVDRKASRQLEQVEPVRALPSTAKRWALIIGVDQYEDGGISGLNGASNDAQSLRDALVKYAGFPEDQIILLASDQSPTHQPRQRNILRSLSRLRRLVPQDGLLLVAFSGHGIERSGRAYLLPSDAEMSNDVNMLEETAISVERMKSDIRATGVKQVFLLIDACRTDPEAGRGIGDNLLTPAFTRGFDFDLRNREVNAFVVLYATEVGQRAYEYGVKKQGYFTWAVVEGLKGAAANERGEVTLAGLVSYVQETVPKYVHRDYGEGKQQRPFVKTEGYKPNELVLAVSSRPPGSSVVATAPNRPAYESAPSTPSTALKDSNANAADKTSALPKATESGAASAPGEARAHFEAARASELKGNYTEAETEYRKALSLAPEKALYHNALGTFLRAKSLRVTLNERADPLAGITQGDDYADYLEQQRERSRISSEMSTMEDCYKRQEDQNRMQRAVEARAADINRRGGRVTPPPPPPIIFSAPCRQPTYGLPSSTTLQPVLTQRAPILNPSVSVPPDFKTDPTAPVSFGALYPRKDVVSPRLSVLDEFLIQSSVPSEALTEFAAAARLEPENATYRFDYGSALVFNFLRYAEAEVEFRAAVKLAPGNAQYHAILGYVLEGQNKWAEAASAYGEAVRLDPENKEYKSAYKYAQQRAK